MEFENLYKLYKEDVFRFLYKMSNYDMHLADELTQETFYHAYLGVDKFNSQSSVKTWLFAIAKNRLFMRWRKNGSGTVPMEDIDIEDGNRSVEEGVWQKQLIYDAIEIVFAMQDNMKDVFLSRIYSKQSYFEISKAMGISETSAKVLFCRAKQKLRKRLKEDYGYEI